MRELKISVIALTKHRIETRRYLPVGKPSILNLFPKSRSLVASTAASTPEIWQIHQQEWVSLCNIWWLPLWNDNAIGRHYARDAFNGWDVTTLGTRGFSSRAMRSFVGSRPTLLRPKTRAAKPQEKTFRAGHFLRLDQNRKPRMKSLWHPGQDFTAVKVKTGCINVNNIEQRTEFSQKQQQQKRQNTDSSRSFLTELDKNAFQYTASCFYQGHPTRL